MKHNFADRLLHAIEEKGSPVCVGLDPVYEKLPEDLKTPGATAAQQVSAIEQFCVEVISAVAPFVPAVKPQIAYFEQYGPSGVAAYFRAARAAHNAGLLVIGDAKRGDIGSTAEAYAAGHLAATEEGEGDAPDALTVNGYFGADGTRPFIATAAANGGGVFVLVRTSNPGGAAIQDFEGMGTDGLRKKFFVHMAEQVAQWGEDESLVGKSGFSCVGAVVGATYPDEARLLRRVMPRQIFLVPGYGAQGASAADCAAAFDDSGRGAIVNASRSVIFAYAKDKEVKWQQAVARAARAFAADIAGALK